MRPAPPRPTPAWTPRSAPSWSTTTGLQPAKYFLCANKYFYRVMLDIKEKEIARLREAVEAGDKQLKIQTKVNEEVKRLLVAR